MTNTQFKNGLQSEMKAEGFSAKIKYFDAGNFNTVLTLNAAPSESLTLWLNRRFTNGVRVAGDQVIINTPNENPNR